MEVIASQHGDVGFGKVGWKCNDITEWSLG
jgi:hypothetical protein